MPDQAHPEAAANQRNGRNLTLLTDLYQINMMWAHYKSQSQDRPVVFDLFFRANPFQGGFAVAAGLENVVRHLKALHLGDRDIAYLRSLGLYDEGFLKTLAGLRFRGDVDAIPEGTLVFPGEPVLRVRAPVLEAQLIETRLLNIVGYETLIATKAARVVQAAGGSRVLEFGARRAHGADAAVWGARAALIAGCTATSNVYTGLCFGGEPAGTHAHSWVQFWGDELQAFRRFAAASPDHCVLLVDTYDTLKSGLPNAITVAKELAAAGHRLRAIRLDSGDLAYLSKEARRMLDAAGLDYVQIVASSELDEYVIRELRLQGARIDVWGVGTNLITARDDPALGAVYKLVAVGANGDAAARIKISNNPAKVTNPGLKRVVRLYGREGKAAADLIMLDDEELDTSLPLTLFDPVHTWKRKTLRHYTARNLLAPIFRQGELVYDLLDLGDIRRHHAADLATFWEEYLRFTNPEVYPVDLSAALWQLKQNLIHAIRGEQ